MSARTLSPAASSADTKDGTRAVRRHHLDRLRTKRKTYGGYTTTCALKDQMSPRALGMLCATPKVCSCWMCGNPRKTQSERTIQEISLMQPLLQDWPTNLPEAVPLNQEVVSNVS
jgi:hypothetical protein